MVLLITVAVVLTDATTLAAHSSQEMTMKRMKLTNFFKPKVVTNKRATDAEKLVTETPSVEIIQRKAVIRLSSTLR